MKLILRLLPMAVALAAIVMIACNKGQKTSTTIQASPSQGISGIKPLPGPIFNKAVGKLFPSDTGSAWAVNYLQLHPGFATNKPCVFNATDLAAIIKTDNCTGISFSNIHSSEGWALLAYGLDGTGAIIKTDSVLSSNGYVSWLKADSLRQAFVYDHPSGVIYSEFFGSDNLCQLINNHGINSLQVQKGYNNKGECMILMDAYSKNYVLEDGATCPPNCPIK